METVEISLSTCFLSRVTVLLMRVFVSVVSSMSCLRSLRGSVWRLRIVLCRDRWPYTAHFSWFTDADVLVLRTDDSLVYLYNVWITDYQIRYGHCLSLCNWTALIARTVHLYTAVTARSSRTYLLVTRSPIPVLVLVKTVGEHFGAVIALVFTSSQPIQKSTPVSSKYYTR